MHGWHHTLPIADAHGGQGGLGGDTFVVPLEGLVFCFRNNAFPIMGAI